MQSIQRRQFSPGEVLFQIRQKIRARSPMSYTRSRQRVLARTATLARRGGTLVLLESGAVSQVRETAGCRRIEQCDFPSSGSLLGSSTSSSRSGNAVSPAIQLLTTAFPNSLSCIDSRRSRDSYHLSRQTPSFAEVVQRRHHGIYLDHDKDSAAEVILIS